MICRGISPQVNHCTLFIFEKCAKNALKHIEKCDWRLFMNMKANFERRVDAICGEVKRLLLEEGQYSHGIEIRVNMDIDKVDSISFEVFEKVKFDGKCID